MGNKQYRRVLIAVVLVALVAGGAGIFIFKREAGKMPAAKILDLPFQTVVSENKEGTDTSIMQKKTYTLTENYHNAKHRFSFKYPSGFAVRESAVSGGESLTVENSSAEGFQIYITPFDETGDITVERIKHDVPDLNVADPRPLLIGASSGKGLAFISDNPAWEGKSREVWFVYRGSLYQISTYARLDTLLQSVFGTWTFE